MRPRTLAIIILILLIGVPLGLYWYFYIHNVAKIRFQVSTPDAIHISLAGTLNYSYLPLADAALHFETECHSTCEIGPMPPVLYQITFSGSGYETAVESYKLSLGEVKSYAFVPEKKFATEKIGTIRSDETIMTSLLDNASSHSFGEFMPIGILPSGKVYVLRTQDSISEVGILTTEKFISLFHLPVAVETANFDLTKQFLIFHLPDGKIFISTLDGAKSFSFPGNTSIQSVMGTPEGIKVRTETGVLSQVDENWIENPRFTDYIDLNARYRIGYIAKTDTEKLELSNYPKGESVLIRVDREIGTSSVIARGFSIAAFAQLDGVFSYIDDAGDIWKIEAYLP